MNLWMKQAFVVKKADGKNRCITYKLKAVLQHQEKQYLLMQAEKPYALADGLMMLGGASGKPGAQALRCGGSYAL